MRIPILTFSIALAIAMAGCTTEETRVSQRYQTVKVSYAYKPNDKSTSEWRASLLALDKCHNDGYQDAYPVGRPAVICAQSAAGECTHFQASAAYDCVGMGYQSN